MHMLKSWVSKLHQTCIELISGRTDSRGKWLFWVFLFVIIVVALSKDVILKGYIIGPWDFLAGWYKPFKSFAMNNPKLEFFATHFKNPLQSDVVAVIFPIKLLAMDFMKSGILPLWDPYILNGSPLLAGLHSSILYPFNVVYFLFDQGIAYTMYILSQLVFGFWFMWLYLRRISFRPIVTFFGSISFAFSSVFVAWLTWGSHGHAFLWLPLALYAIEGMRLKWNVKDALLFVISLTFSVFAGHPITSFMVWVTAILYALHVYISRNDGLKQRFIRLFKDRTFSLKNFIQHRDKKSTMVVHVLLMVLIAGFLVSIQLVPSIEMEQLSVRETATSENLYEEFTFLPYDYVQIFAPDFFGNPVTRNWWGRMNYAERNIFFGTIVFVFALYEIGRRISKRKLTLKNDTNNVVHKRVFHFFAVLGAVIFVVTTRNPISRLIFEAGIPIVSSSALARNGALFALSGTIIGTFGFSHFIDDMYLAITQQNTQLKTWLRWFSLGIFAFLALFWVVILIGLPSHIKEHSIVMIRNSILPTALAGFVAVLAIIAAVPRKKILKKFLNKDMLKLVTASLMLSPLIIVLVFSVEMYRYTHKYTPFTPRELMYPQHEFFDRMSEQTVDGRYINIIPANVNSLYKIRGVKGRQPLYNLQLGELASMGDGDPTVTDRAGLQFDKHSEYQDRVYDLFSVKYFVDQGDQIRNIFVEESYGGDHELFNERYETLWEIDNLKVYENVEGLPRFGMYYQTELVADKDERLNRLVESSFDYRGTIVVENQEAVVNSASPIEEPEDDTDNVLLRNPAENVTITKDHPLRQAFSVETNREGMFMLTDTYYPGWKAYVDDEESPIYRANHAFQAVQVPEGEHEVVFTYEPQSFATGMTISGVGLFLLVLYMLFGKKIVKE